MAGFVEGVSREQSTLFPAQHEDYVAEDNPVRAVDVFVDGLDLDKLGFMRVQPLDVGRPGYHPRTMLKLYIYGYLNRVPSSRRLERECQRKIEVIWNPTSRPLPISARTTAPPFAKSAASSSRSAASSICLAREASPSMARSSSWRSQELHDRAPHARPLLTNLTPMRIWI